MSFKPFFIHLHHKPGPRPSRNPRGFTAYIAPGKDDRRVEMKLTWCSHKDMFCKREGRKNALLANSETFHKREVARILGVAEFHCKLSDTINENNWNYVFKYMV